MKFLKRIAAAINPPQRPTTPGIKEALKWQKAVEKSIRKEF